MRLFRIIVACVDCYCEKEVRKLAGKTVCKDGFDKLYKNLLRQVGGSINTHTPDKIAIYILIVLSHKCVKSLLVAIQYPAYQYMILDYARLLSKDIKCLTLILTMLNMKKI